MHCEIDDIVGFLMTQTGRNLSGPDSMIIALIWHCDLICSVASFSVTITAIGVVVGMPNNNRIWYRNNGIVV